MILSCCVIILEPTTFLFYELNYTKLNLYHLEPPLSVLFQVTQPTCSEYMSSLRSGTQA